jgi:cysteine-rich repeat protein
VTQFTAGLIYYKQSGALNESYSDIFGETVDVLNGAGWDPPEARWVIGEDVFPIRHMGDPTLVQDPGKMSDPQYVCTEDDDGGVHTNSGVGNHAYALMVDGGAYNGYTITGIGLTKAAKIEYRALAQYLTPASDYRDNYDALLQSCADLIGSSGISAADCDEVGKALDAVEMSSPSPCACGDGVLDPGEECDDGNKDDGDGCSAECQAEAAVPTIPQWSLIGFAALLLGTGRLVLHRRRREQP